MKNINQPAYVAGVFHPDGEEDYKGYYDPNENWNGFAVPCFEREVAEKILKDAKVEKIIWEGTTVWFSIDDMPHSCQAETIIVNGESKTVYPVGGYLWCWSLVTDDEE